MKVFLAFTFLLALPEDFFTPFSLYRAHPLALKKDTIVSALHRFLLVCWCKYWSMLHFTWLQISFSGWQNTTKPVPLRNPECCMRHYALLRPSFCTSWTELWSLSPASSRCSLSQHHAMQEWGGSLLLLPHGAKCLHRAIYGVCMHISDLLRPSQSETQSKTTGTG